MGLCMVPPSFPPQRNVSPLGRHSSRRLDKKELTPSKPPDFTPVANSYYTRCCVEMSYLWYPHQVPVAGVVSNRFSLGLLLEKKSSSTPLYASGSFSLYQHRHAYSRGDGSQPSPSPVGQISVLLTAFSLAGAGPSATGMASAASFNAALVPPNVARPARRCSPSPFRLIL